MLFGLAPETRHANKVCTDLLCIFSSRLTGGDDGGQARGRPVELRRDSGALLDNELEAPLGCGPGGDWPAGLSRSRRGELLGLG